MGLKLNNHALVDKLLVIITSHLKEILRFHLQEVKAVSTFVVNELAYLIHGLEANSREIHG